MNCVLLCAGFATRMYPLTRDFPKPLLEVAGVPVLDYLMRQLMEIPQLQQIHLVTNARFYQHFLAWSREWKGPLDKREVTLTLYDDGATDNENRLGAVGDLGLVLRAQEAPAPTLVVAGDNIFRFALPPLAARALTEERSYVVALEERDVARLRRTGVLELDDDDRVAALHEKPETPPSSWACPPLYFLNEQALACVHEYLRLPDASDAPGHFVSFLCGREPVYAFRVAGERLDIGSCESFESADRLLRQETVLPEEG